MRCLLNKAVNGRLSPVKQALSTCTVTGVPSVSTSFLLIHDTLIICQTCKYNNYAHHSDKCTPQKLRYICYQVVSAFFRRVKVSLHYWKLFCNFEFVQSGLSIIHIYICMCYNIIMYIDQYSRARYYISTGKSQTIVASRLRNLIFSIYMV